MNECAILTKKENIAYHKCWTIGRDHCHRYRGRSVHLPMVPSCRRPRTDNGPRTGGSRRAVRPDLLGGQKTDFSFGPFMDPAALLALHACGVVCNWSV
jgi:hypothetical protein